ncbi:hypothetical protein GCM10028817_47790 [Spirosoma pomorum]
MIDKLDDHLKRHDKLCDTLNTLKSTTSNGVRKDLKFDLSHLTDFDKVAVVTDKQWLSITSVLPGLGVRFFKFSEQEPVRQWVKR